MIKRLLKSLVSKFPGGALGRRTRLEIFSAAGLGLLLAIAVVANLLAQKIFFRWDWTDENRYSLSAASKRILKNLEDPVTVRTYFSTGLPPQFTATQSYLQNLLHEYQTYSGGHLKYEAVPEQDSEEFRKEAIRQGIYPIRFNIISRDRYELREGFMGLTLQYEDKKEVLPVLQETSGLEYDLTSRIKKLAASKKKTLGFLTSHGALSPFQLDSKIRERLEENYEIESFSLKSSTPAIPKDLDALMILGPQEKFEPRESKPLEEFLNSGKSAVIALDARNVDLRTFYASEIPPTGLEGLLEKYGIGTENSLVLDLQSQRVSIASQQGWLQVTNIVEYPYFVMATDLSSENPITRELDSIVLPYASPLTLSTQTASATAFQVLVRSSKRSWTRKNRRKDFNVNPYEVALPEEEDPKGPFTLAAAATQGETRLVALGSSRIFHPDFTSTDANQVFLLNLADYLAQDTDLISIRSKGVAYKPLREIPQNAKFLVRHGTHFLPPLGLVGAGLLQWRRRRRQKAEKREIYLRVRPESPSAP